MQIKMMGIDHNNASVEAREKFSFTSNNKKALLEKIYDVKGISGVVIISTCNRMEIWLSTEEEFDKAVFDVFCSTNESWNRINRDLFIERSGMEAINHLFYMTCGMKSQVVGEDQILSQVKEALSFSRENYCTDNVLEILFRMSITAGKKVKDKIHLSKTNKSTVHKAISILKERGLILSEKRCLVIGNGEVGKLAATLLKEEGADVTVTVRQYKSGVVEIPKGCNRIDYGKRLESISDFDVIVSGTASPNVTLKFDDLSKMKFKKNTKLVDLAVPRDIEPEINEIENIELFNIDNIHEDIESKDLKKQMKHVDRILEEHINEFVSWYKCKDVIPYVGDICKNAATDVNLRLEKRLKQIELSQHEKEHLEKSIYDATGKVINKMIFGLKENLEPEAFQECVEAIKKVYN